MRRRNNEAIQKNSIEVDEGITKNNARRENKDSRDY